MGLRSSALVSEASLGSIFEGNKPAVIIAGDGGSELQNLVDVLDVLKSTGIPAASIIAKAR